MMDIKLHYEEKNLEVERQPVNIGKLPQREIATAPASTHNQSDPAFDPDYESDTD